MDNFGIGGVEMMRLKNTLKPNMRLITLSLLIFFPPLPFDLRTGRNFAGPMARHSEAKGIPVQWSEEKKHNVENRGAGAGIFLTGHCREPDLDDQLAGRRQIVACGLPG